MLSNRQAGEQRSAYRYPVAGQSEDSILRFEDRDIQAVLVDESAGGFAVRIGEPPPIEVGDSILFGSPMGCSRVRVVHVTQESSPERTEAEGDRPDGSTWILGLERIDDLIVDELPRVRALSSLRHSLGGIMDPTTILSAAAIVVLCIGGLWATTGRLARKPLGRIASSDDRRAASAGATKSSQQPTGRSTRRSEAAETPVWTWREARSDNDAAGESSSSRRNPIRRRPQQLRQTPAVVTLLSPRMIEQLSLTEEQQSAIRRILESSTLFREHSGSWVLRMPDQLDESLKAKLVEVERAALEHLSEAQLALWYKLRSPSSDRGMVRPTSTEKDGVEATGELEKQALTPQ